MVHTLIYTTHPSLEAAREISKTLVDERLVACANIFPAHESLYWWDGAVQSGVEIAVIYKTTAERVDALSARFIALHPYECPCFVAIPIERGHPAFLEWIEAQTAR